MFGIDLVLVKRFVTFCHSEASEITCSCFTGRYPALTQLRFIFSVKRSCIKGLRCFGGPFWAGDPGENVPLLVLSPLVVMYSSTQRTC